MSFLRCVNKLPLNKLPLPKLPLPMLPLFEAQQNQWNFSGVFSHLFSSSNRSQSFRLCTKDLLMAPHLSWVGWQHRYILTQCLLLVCVCVCRGLLFNDAVSPSIFQAWDWHYHSMGSAMAHLISLITSTADSDVSSQNSIKRLGHPNVWSLQNLSIL